jgi:hypothetical protein
VLHGLKSLSSFSEKTVALILVVDAMFFTPIFSLKMYSSIWLFKNFYNSNELELPRRPYYPLWHSSCLQGIPVETPNGMAGKQDSGLTATPAN